MKIPFRRICFYGGPGCGKSTLTHMAFSILKRQGYEVQVAREVVKSWAYRGQVPTKWDQIYLLGQQFHEESSLLETGKVDIMVCESPLLLGCYYTKELFLPLRDTYYEWVDIDVGLTSLIRKFDSEFPPIHIFIRRGEKQFEKRGRFQTEQEAKEMDTEIREFVLPRTRQGSVRQMNPGRATMSIDPIYELEYDKDPKILEARLEEILKDAFSL